MRKKNAVSSLKIKCPNFRGLVLKSEYNLVLSKSAFAGQTLLGVYLVSKKKSLMILEGTAIYII